jgi:exosortase K
MREGRLPWISWGTALLAAYGLKLHYSRASAGDLSWILAPTARAVGGLRGETLTLDPAAGWTAPDVSYVIAPACAGVNFMILALTVAVLGFAHRMRSPGRRAGWWLASLAGAWTLTVAVNTLRILASVELYRRGPVLGLTAEAAHRLLGAVLYLSALWGLFAALDRLTSGRPASPLLAVLLVPGAYLGMTVVTPVLTGGFRQAGARYLEHAMMVSLVSTILIALLFMARRRRLDGKTDDPGGRG